MKRVGFMLSRHRYLTLAAIALLVAAGAVAAFSSAAFSYKTSNPSNTFTAGILQHSNSKLNAAILTASLMKPGDSVTGSVTITNTGNIPGVFSLSQSGLVDTLGPNGGALSDVLQLTIVDTGAPVPPVYNGLLKDMGTLSLGTWAAGAGKTYDFTVTFPDGGPPPDNTHGDNAYQGSSLTVQFDWNETQT
jgi:hypothetical protein